MRLLILLFSLLFGKATFAFSDCDSLLRERNYVLSEMMRLRFMMADERENDKSERQFKNDLEFNYIFYAEAYKEVNFTYKCNCELNREQALKTPVCEEFLWLKPESELSAPEGETPL